MGSLAVGCFPQWDFPLLPGACLERLRPAPGGRFSLPVPLPVVAVRARRASPGGGVRPRWTHIGLTLKVSVCVLWGPNRPAPGRDHLLYTFHDVLPKDREVLELLTDVALVPRPTEAEKKRQ